MPRDFESGAGPSAYFSPREPGTLQVSVREGSQDEPLGQLATERSEGTDACIVLAVKLSQLLGGTRMRD